MKVGGKVVEVMDVLDIAEIVESVARGVKVRDVEWMC